MKRVLFFACLFVSAVSLQAATRTWSGAVSAAWSNPANWEEGVVPAAGDALVFPPLSRTPSINDLADAAYQSITVTHDQTVHGNPITITGEVYVSPQASNVILYNLVATTPQTWTCEASWRCRYYRATISATVTVASSMLTELFYPGGVGTVVQERGGLDLVLEGTPAWTGTVVQESGALSVAGPEGDAVDIESSLTCPWSGCTEGVSFTTAELRSLHAGGGYVRATNQYPTPNDAAILLGSLYLGSQTELDITNSTNEPIFSVAASVAAGTDGTVTLDGGTLSLRPLEHTGFLPFAQFMTPGYVIPLIVNDGIDPVAGTFRGLPEGATLRSRTGQRFRISYVGGTGNDVTLTATAHYGAPMDLDANGKSDILWRHAATGENYRWMMNAAAVASAGPLNVVADLNWKVVAQADFDGDGDGDVLWRHAVRGENYMYLMQDGAIAGAGLVNTVDPSWFVGAAGDLNGDGRADIIWRNQWTNEIYVYLMNGLAIHGGGALRNVSFDWVIGGTGDLNADGRDDIVWNHPSTGEVWVWLLDDFTILDEGHVGFFPGYVVVGVGQFNTRADSSFDTDHFADIVLRNETTGELDIRIMQGTSFRRWPSAPSGRRFTAIVAPEWKIEAIADYNGDSSSDLLWRHSTTGENFLWIFNPLDAQPPYYGYVLTEVPDLNWKIVP